MEFFLTLILLLISPLCLISFVLAIMLFLLVLLVDSVIFIISGKRPLFDPFVMHYFDEISFGWFFKLSDKLL